MVQAPPVQFFPSLVCIGFSTTFFSFFSVDVTSSPPGLWISGTAPNFVRPGPWFERRRCTSVLLYMGGWAMSGWVWVSWYTGPAGKVFRPLVLQRATSILLILLECAAGLSLRRETDQRAGFWGIWLATGVVRLFVRCLVCVAPTLPQAVSRAWYHSDDDMVALF